MVIDEARTVASNLGFEEQFKQKRQRKRKALPDEDPRNAHIQANEEDRFRIDVFYVALDKLTQEIELRSQKAANIMICFHLFGNQVKVMQTPNVAKAAKFAKFYSKDLTVDDFSEETLHMTMVGKELFGTVLSLNLLNLIYQKGLQNIFPQTCIALRILITIPVSVAEGERIFSKLSVVKNHLRSTIGQERLSHLILMSCEHDLAN